MRLRVVLPLLLALGCLPAALHAQGTVVGRVLDEQGDPVASATVELRAAGDVAGRTLSDADGRFRFEGVGVGAYRVAAERIGHQPAISPEFRLGAGEERAVELVLGRSPVEIAGLLISGVPPRVGSGTAELPTRIDERAIRRLPVTSDPLDLVSLVPGARPGHIWGAASAQANAYFLDGLAISNPGVGGELLQPSMSWIEAVEVRGLGAGAEYGGFQGGMVRMVTRRGWNEARGSGRVGFESHRLNATNLVPGEIGSETAGRREVEAEASGPVVRDRLFYFAGAHLLDRETRVQNHLPGIPDRFSPWAAEHREARLLGKLTWEPSPRDELSVTGGHFAVQGERQGLTGYEAPEATWRHRAPTSFLQVEGERRWSPQTALELSLGGTRVVSDREPYGGLELPGIAAMGPDPHRTDQNSPLALRHRAATLGGRGVLRTAIPLVGRAHPLVIGAEGSGGSWRDQRIRTGGMTWRHFGRGNFNPADPRTWSDPRTPVVATTWGGEVDLDARVENLALFAQPSLDLGAGVMLTPGVRYGRWRGYLTPVGGGDRFLAAADAAAEPRVGVSWDVGEREMVVLKAHWGRYHQAMMAQFFDRAEGGNVFSDEELWYFLSQPDDPGRTFTLAERDSLAARRQFEIREVHRLNESGRVEGYRQPYVDQLVLGGEAMVGSRMKATAAFVARENRQMVALVDRNLASNYTLYENVAVASYSGGDIMHGTGPLILDRVYIPNDIIRQHLIWLYEEGCACVPPPPGFTGADIDRLTYEPDYVLTNAPDARRSFRQVQLALEGAFPRWSFFGSLVRTWLEGNLDNVTGYDDPAGFGAGPYARPNELTNRHGPLPNSSELELKLALFRELPWRLRMGMVLSQAHGERFTPHLTLSGLHNEYWLADTGEELDFRLVLPVAGQRIFVEERGRNRYASHTSLDLRLEREVALRNGTWSLTLDVFNLLNAATMTRAQMEVNRGLYEAPFRPADPNALYMAARERVPPRTVRLGSSVRF
jgi:hypothetical protein